jgi:hypothetical protein
MLEANAAGPVLTTGAVAGTAVVVAMLGGDWGSMVANSVVLGG